MAVENEQKLYDLLNGLGIPHCRYEHPPVYTVEQASQYWSVMSGTHCKNLFLRNKKGNRHYLLVFEHSKRADLKQLAKQLGEETLSLASEERLTKYLGLTAGAVSPFGLINDRGKEVQVVLDSDLKTADQVNFHPNVNIATISISSADFQKFLASCGNKLRYLTV